MRCRPRLNGNNVAAARHATRTANQGSSFTLIQPGSRASNA